MTQRKITEQEMAFILDRMDSFGPGASLRDKLWSIWVKGTGSQWIYHDMAGDYKIVGSEELLRTHGFAGFRTTGLESTPDPLSRTEEMNPAGLKELGEKAVYPLDVGGTVVAHDGTIWVQTGGWEWVHVTSDGGFILITLDELATKYGPLVARSDGKVQLGISTY